MRRFFLYVLPGGFHRIRHYGLIAIPNTGRHENHAQGGHLLQLAPKVTEQLNDETSDESVQPTFVCPHCGVAMIINRYLGTSTA